MYRKDRKQLQEAYNAVNKDQYDMLFDWLGGASDTLDAGHYVGVKGVDAVKNMVLDTYTDEEPELKPFVAAAIDTLTKKQLLELILVNYAGEPLSSLPSAVQEFHSGDDDYFEPANSSDANEALERGVKYFQSEDLSIPGWAQRRDDAREIRDAYVRQVRKRRR